METMAASAAVTGLEAAEIAAAAGSEQLPIAQRKYSIHQKAGKLQQQKSQGQNPAGGKQIIKMAKKTFTEKIGMNRSRKRENDSEDALYEISRCNSYDFDHATGEPIVNSDTVFFKERHLVPSKVVQSGLARFNLLLDMSPPGTVPDPLLIAALIDLVR